MMMMISKNRQHTRAQRRGRNEYTTAEEEEEKSQSDIMQRMVSNRRMENRKVKVARSFY